MTNTLITWACGHFVVGSSETCMSTKDTIDSTVIAGGHLTREQVYGS